MFKCLSPLSLSLIRYLPVWSDGNRGKRETTLMRCQERLPLPTHPLSWRSMEDTKIDGERASMETCNYRVDTKAAEREGVKSRGVSQRHRGVRSHDATIALEYLY